MPIPESQLETWSHQGATVSAQTTHTSIRAALVSDSSPIADRIRNKSVEIYLQGSYRNDTNIRGDSDVDVIVELTATFGHNAHSLPPDQKRIHDAVYSSATYEWDAFFKDVVTALTRYYDSSKVDTTGSKSIKLLPIPGRLKADIVPAIKYRQYSHFHGENSYRAQLGIKFYNRNTRASIINFPHHHYQNGVTKHSEEHTNGWFKPTVRIFKNMRTYLVENGLLNKDAAPSYFLQGLLYNIPNQLFGPSYEQTVFNILTHFHQNPVDHFVCQNGQLPLFGSTSEQWNLDDAQITINALIECWDNWNTR